ncbi:unnamed protein product [Peniophora sp. CBMAI 1063]|nr:unnamed protein product [Peniophora sp. CBMAI 1063]
MHIEDLNLDILAVIFEFCADNTETRLAYPSPHNHLGWTRLAGVNRRWRGLLLAMPRLWGLVVSYAPSKTMFDIYLSRSRNAPIVLYYPPWVNYNGTTIFPIKSIDHDLVPRAQTLIDHGYAEHNRLIFTGRTLPLLQFFRTANCQDPDHPLVAPSLLHLHSSGIQLSIQAPNLRILYIEYSRDDRERLVGLPAALAAYPCLEEVTIEPDAYYKRLDWRDLHLDIRAGIANLDRGQLPVQMPRLQTFTISASALYLAFFWRSVVLSHTATVQFTASGGYVADNVELLSAIQTRLSSPLCDTLSIAAHSRVKFEDRRGEWQVTKVVLSRGTESDSIGSCTVAFVDDTGHSAFTSAVLLHSGPVGEYLRTLVLDFDTRRNSVPPLASYFEGAYASIETLKLRGTASTLGDFLDVYELPHLQTLVFDCRDQYDAREMECLLRQLRSRQSKLRRLVLRGETTFTDEAQLKGEIGTLRLNKAAEVVEDERTWVV